jgi:uncharacterized protein (DUF305 family)
MANTELRDGSLSEVKRLAQQIIDEQWRQEWATAPSR